MKKTEADKWCDQREAMFNAWKRKQNNEHMKTERLIIRINADLKAEFKRRCEIEGKSMSEKIVEYVKWENQKPE